MNKVTKSQSRWTQFFKYPVLLIIMILILSACTVPGSRNSSDLVRETFDVSNFDRISMSAPGELFITQTGEESLSVETDSNVMQHVKIKVRNGTLYIELRNLVLTSPTKLTFNLTVDQLSGLVVTSSGDSFIDDISTERLEVEISGSGDIEFDDIDTEHLEIEINGSGDTQIDSLETETADIQIDGSGRIEIGSFTTEVIEFILNSSGSFTVDSLSSDELEIICNGSGKVNLAGETLHQDISIRGSANYMASRLMSETADININSSGSVDLWVIEFLKVRIGGSGDVSYYGTPRLEFSGNGSGDLHSLGDK